MRSFRLSVMLSSLLLNVGFVLVFALRGHRDSLIATPAESDPVRQVWREDDDVTSMDTSEPPPSRSGGIDGMATTPSGQLPLQPAKLLVILRSHGLPAGYTRALMKAYMKHRIDSYVAAEMSKLPYWQREIPASLAAEKKSMEESARTSISELFKGESVLTDRAVIQRYFGDVPVEVAGALERIGTDYTELYASVRADRTLSAEERNRLYRVITSERDRDIRALLTPEQMIEFNRRNSAEARSLSSYLHDIAVTPYEYERLFDATIAQPPKQTTPLGREVYLSAAREILGDDRFYEFVKAADKTYAALEATVKDYGVQRAEIYQAATLERKVLGGVLSPQEAYAQLLQLLEAKAAEAYLRSPSGKWGNALDPTK